MHTCLQEESPNPYTECMNFKGMRCYDNSRIYKQQKPVMVLIHGVLTPWQIWKPQIEFFKNSYTVYVVSLNAHNEEKASEFISVKAEAEQIVMLLIEKGIQTIDALCGISLGGKIAYEIWKSGKIEISNLIMDGAPLVKCPKFAVNIMINNYKNIIHKSKKRDAKIIENFKNIFFRKNISRAI